MHVYKIDRDRTRFIGQFLTLDTKDSKHSGWPKWILIQNGEALLLRKVGNFFLF